MSNAFLKHPQQLTVHRQSISCAASLFFRLQNFTSHAINVLLWFWTAYFCRQWNLHVFCAPLPCLPSILHRQCFGLVLPHSSWPINTQLAVFLRCLVWRRFWRIVPATSYSGTEVSGLPTGTGNLLSVWCVWCLYLQVLYFLCTRMLLPGFSSEACLCFVKAQRLETKGYETFWVFLRSDSLLQMFCCTR